MFIRSSGQQKIHDEVTQHIVAYYTYKKCKICVNPGNQINFIHENKTPDIKVDIKGRDYIFEVETDETISYTHAAGHWDEFAKLFNYTLVVPENRQYVARAILSKILKPDNIIKVNIATWKKIDNNYKIDGLPY